MDKKRSVDELLDVLGELPPMPAVARKAVRMIQNPEANMQDVADILSMDEALTSLILRWANSAYYGLARPVSTVRQAMVYLGFQTIENLVMAASLVPVMDVSLPGYDMARGELWKHSIAVAAGARAAVEKFDHQVREDAYYAGLLCDIGKLAMEIMLRDNPDFDAQPMTQNFDFIEKTYFGITHAELGCELAKRWNLPVSLQEAIAYHHQPELANRGAVLASAVHVADCAVSMMGIGIGRDALQYVPSEAAFKRIGWDIEQYGQIVEMIRSFLAEAETFLDIERI